MAKRGAMPYTEPDGRVEMLRSVEIYRENFEQQALLDGVPAKCVRLALAPPEGIPAGVVPMEVLPADDGQPTLATLISTGDPVPATTNELVTALAESVQRHGLLPIPIIEDANGEVIDGHARRAVERQNSGVVFPTLRLDVSLTRSQRNRLRLALNGLRKQMTPSQFALAVAIEHQEELRVGPGRRKKNSPAQDYSRDELAREYGITRSLLSAAITVARSGGHAIESVFNPSKKADVTKIAKAINHREDAHALGVSGNPTDLWVTQPHITTAVNAAFGGDWHDAFTLASNPAGAPSDDDGRPRIYTEADDAFKQPGYTRMWANGPFSQLQRSLEWAVQHAAVGQQIYMLCPAEVERSYIQAAMRKTTDVLFVLGRPIFGKPKADGTLDFKEQAKFGILILGFNISTRLLVENGVKGMVVVVPHVATQDSDDAGAVAIANRQARSTPRAVPSKSRTKRGAKRRVA